jgi:hypothetical protein
MKQVKFKILKNLNRKRLNRIHRMKKNIKRKRFYNKKRNVNKQKYRNKVDTARKLIEI